MGQFILTQQKRKLEKKNEYRKESIDKFVINIKQDTTTKLGEKKLNEQEIH